MTNNKQQSSVEWFLDQLIEHRIIIVDKTTYQVKYKHEILLEQAKEMEKEQIIEAFEIGIQSEFFNQTFNAPCKDGEQYYTETYKQ
jgi:hypothetical protein